MNSEEPLRDLSGTFFILEMCALAVLSFSAYMHSALLFFVFLVAWFIFGSEGDRNVSTRSRIERERVRHHLPLLVAGLNPSDFYSGSEPHPWTVAGRAPVWPEQPASYGYFHRESGKEIHLSLAPKFWVFRDGIYEGRTLESAFGGRISAGDKCKKLVEVDRSEALKELGLA